MADPPRSRAQTLPRSRAQTLPRSRAQTLPGPVPRPSQGPWSDPPRSRGQTLPHVANPFHSALCMERYLLCGEILSLPLTSAVYKGRRRGTVEFFAIHKYDKAAKDRVANGVR